MIFEHLQGRFLVLDGPDGSGKSTQLALLAERARAAGVAVEQVRDPGGTAIGEQIRQILLHEDHGAMGVHCEMLLYMASRAQLYAERIGPALDAGKLVLCDRWISSTYAYQAVAGGIGAEAVLRVAQIALPRTWPDLTVLVDVPAEVGLARVGSQRDRMEGKGYEFHARVREAFLALAGQHQDRIAVVDGRGDIEAVHGRICEVIQACRCLT